MGKRLEYDGDQAAGRLRVPRAAFRWAVHAGVVPAADAAPGVWSRAAVESMEAAAVLAALPDGPMSGYQAAERLAEALAPWPVTVGASAVRELAAAGLLLDLSGNPDTPLFHPAQVETLAARPDLAQVMTEAVPLGPDQAAARLGVRRSDFNHVVRLGWITARCWATVRFPSSQGGPVDVPLYRAEDIDALAAAHPEVDWPALRTLGKGQRSPLARLSPAGAGR
ncbi:hypothetical protein [Streptomyces sp. NPDC020817]|uniref:hypothetical protein n=1 Tax=Streptomyces sp. NPDC020817 TaxID=3365095 RepID=UPI00378C4FD1